MKEADPKVKLEQTEVKKPTLRVNLPDIDAIIERRANDEMLGTDYCPHEDAEDISNYFEPYQND